MWPLLAAHTDRQGLVIETIALTGSAGQLIHVETHLSARVIAIGFMVTTFDIIDNSLKRNVDIAHTAKFILIVKMKFFAIRAVENQVLIFF
ncbi:Uncharacterised protein [Streptococcus pneumoniae]|nr:Uncharacterised protein [Streptococcus pneumoniae]